MNDAGYLSRNNLNHAQFQVNRRFTTLPETSRYASKDWRACFIDTYDWIVSARQELRLKLQAIGINAKLRQGYRIDTNGNVLVSVQLRYRYATRSNCSSS